MNKARGSLKRRYTHSRDPQPGKDTSSGHSHRSCCSEAVPAARCRNCKTLGARGRAGQGFKHQGRPRAGLGLPRCRQPAPCSSSCRHSAPAPRTARPYLLGRASAEPGASPPAAAARAPAEAGGPHDYGRSSGPDFPLSRSSVSPLCARPAPRLPAVPVSAPLRPGSRSGRAREAQEPPLGPAGRHHRARRRHAPFKRRRRRLPLVRP